MVSAFVSRSSGPVSSPGREHCVVFMGKALFSHYGLASHPGEGKALFSHYGLASHPKGGGRVKILLVASCYRNKDKLRSVAPLGSYIQTLPLPFTSLFGNLMIY